MFGRDRHAHDPDPDDPDGHRSSAPPQWIYRNLTPWRIHACFTGDGALLARDAAASDVDGAETRIVKVLSIPALGETTMPDEDARGLNTLDMRRLGQIAVRPAPSELMTNLPRIIVIFGWLGVALAVGAWALFGGGGGGVPWAAAIAAAVAVPLIAIVVASVRELLVYRRFSRYRRQVCRASTSGSVEGVGRDSRIRTFVDGVPRQTAEVAVLIGVMAVSVLGLGVAIHLTTQLVDLLPIDYGAILRLDNPFHEVSELAWTSPAFWQLLVGHVAQWVLVSVAALVPAAMYFQFDRQRLASVQRRWVQEVFRLDPTVRTVRDVEAKYGSQIEASFGDLSPDSGLRLRSGRRSPVIVATVLLVIGWFLVISTTQVPNLVEVPTEVVPAASPATGDTTLVWESPAVPVTAADDPTGTGGDTVTDAAPVNDGSFPVSSFFAPNLSLIGYAFLGAYVFTLFHVIHGYQRRDLHPKTYNTIVVRILAAYALALVVSVVYDGPAAEVVMFFVGFMPQSALVWLREQLARDNGIGRVLPLREPAPLTELEGIDLYDRTRLAEEGINNVEALAHADIVDLMSSTRISAAELVDWTDQAILYLRVGGDALAQTDDRSPGTTMPPDVRQNLNHLRWFGIRTATDLQQAYDEALRRGGDDEDRRVAEVVELRRALDLPHAPPLAAGRTIQTIIDTLPDEEWFVQVRNWRNPEFGAADAWYCYLDGHDWTLTRAALPERVQNAVRPFECVPLAAQPTDDAEPPGPAPGPGPSAHIGDGALVTPLVDHLTRNGA